MVVCVMGDPKSHLSLMRNKATFVLFVALSYVAADASAILAISICSKVRSNEASGTCCCGPMACPDEQATGAGLTSGCCNLRVPDRNAVPGSSPSREGAPTPSAVPVSQPDADAQVATAIDGLANAVEERPLHGSPPLYDLFRAYRN